MFFNKFSTKFLVSAVVLKAVDEENSFKNKIYKCKASELPIYVDNENILPKTNDTVEEVCHPAEPNTLEKAVSVVRKRVWIMNDYVRLYKSEFKYILQDCSASIVSAYKYLSVECDDKTRAGAVSLSAATGFILGLRGGIIRRLFYASVAGVGMAAICYPKLAEQYSQDIIAQSRKFSTIGYNFVMGVKKDDIPMPEFPKLGDIWGRAGEFGKSASSLITGTASPEEPETKPEEPETEPEEQQVQEQTNQLVIPNPDCPHKCWESNPDNDKN